MKHRELLKRRVMTTMNGMTYGLFATLIIGVIIQQIGNVLGLGLLSETIYGTLRNLMGAGIGLGIGLSLGLTGLRLVSVTAAGAIATSFRMSFSDGLIQAPNNEPLTVYLVVVLTIALMSVVLRKRTPIDILLIPLVAVATATLLTLGLSAPVRAGVDAIATFVREATLYQPFVMSVIIAVVMGMLLTSPLSSAAIAITINLSGVAGGAAVIGTTAQMIGFAIQSRKDNSAGVVLSVAFGTSMLQFKNIIKKPVIWLPTIITSAILAPVFVLGLGTETSSVGAGMGSSGLVGPLQTLEWMDYSTQAWLSVGLMIVMSAVITDLVDMVFRKKGLIIDGDLAVSKDI